MRLSDDTMQKRDRIALSIIKKNPDALVTHISEEMREKTGIGMDVRRIPVLKDLATKPYDLGTVRGALYPFQESWKDKEAVPMALDATAAGEKSVQSNPPTVTKVRKKPGPKPGSKRKTQRKLKPLSSPSSGLLRTNNPNHRRDEVEEALQAGAQKLYALMRKHGVWEMRVAENVNDPNQFEFEYERVQRVSKTVKL